MVNFQDHLLQEPIYLRPKRDFLKRAFPEENVPGAWHLRGFTVYVPVEGDILTGVVRLYAHSSSPAALSCDVIGRPPLPSSDCPEAYALIKGWMSTCVHNHEHCRQTLSGTIIDDMNAPKLPTRIVDVGPSDGTEAPRLVESQGASGFYAALSHCWGPPHKHPLMTTHATLQERLTSIPWSVMSKAYRDAIIAIRQIGLRYIWIDSLCIVQDDHDDWLKESKKMGLIYESARLTIAASHAADCSQGCFFERPQEQEAIELPHINSRGELAGSIFATVMRNDYTTISPEFGPLATRAWATQEWLLSRRMIFYAEGCIVWSCKVITQRETGGSFHSTARNPRWKFIVEKYSARSLTKATDRLVALEGLRTEMQKKTRDTYCYGMWRNGLPDQLLWHCVEPAQRSMSPLDIPTWSWASTMHGIRFLNIKKAKNVCKGLKFDDKHGTLTIRSRMKRIHKILTLSNPDPGDFGKGNDDLTAVRYNTFLEEIQNAIPAGMTCTICTDQTEVLGWGILDEVQPRTTSTHTFCLSLMSRKGVMTKSHGSNEDLESTVNITWQEDWVMLLRQHETDVDAYERIGVGKVFWKFGFQDEPLQHIRIL